MILVTIVFLIFLSIGMPVAFAIGIAGLTFFLQHPELPFSMVVQLPLSQTQNSPLLAVPLFIFAGNLMNSAGITERLIRLSTLLTGHIRGGLAQVSVVLSTLMGGVSGSATADAAMEARLLGIGMVKKGYSKGYTASVIGFTSLITATIPPGVGIIIYGTTGDVSIGQLFMAGLIVGLIMMIMLMVTVAITAKIRGYVPERPKRATIKEIATSLGETIWALMFPILLLVGLRFGLFTPSEVGAFACVRYSGRDIRVQGAHLEEIPRNPAHHRGGCRCSDVHHCVVRAFSIRNTLRACPAGDDYTDHRFFDQSPRGSLDRHRISNHCRHVHRRFRVHPAVYPDPAADGGFTGCRSGALWSDHVHDYYHGPSHPPGGHIDVCSVWDPGMLDIRLFTGDVSISCYRCC